MMHAQLNIELDAGPRKSLPASERFCAATASVRPVDEMIRFVLAPDGVVLPDLKRCLPGRGLWVTATKAALKIAISRKAFARGFKRPVTASPDLIDTTETLLEKGALAALAVAHKAGRVAIGYAKTEAALERGFVAALLHAAEAAPDGAGKLNALARRGEDPAGAKIAIIDGFASTQLDLALGRSNVIHAAVLGGRESETFRVRVERLGHFRTGGLGDRNGPNQAPKPG
jgi:predicted RNA-binding protein YlxR (DUF448 family)